MENKQFKIEGLVELESALKQLPIDLQARILKAFITKTGKKFIVDELKTVLNYSERTEKNIKVISNTNNKLSVSAGINSRGFRLRWTDLGTKIRKTKKGYNRGQITGKNQIQPTIEKQIEPIVDYTQKEIGNEINNNLQRRLKKLRKK